MQCGGKQCGGKQCGGKLWSTDKSERKQGWELVLEKGQVLGEWKSDPGNETARIALSIYTKSRYKL